MGHFPVRLLFLPCLADNRREPFAVRFLSTLLLCLCSLASLSFARDLAPLRVGMELSYPPFEMADAKGQPEGVSVDLARELEQVTFAVASRLRSEAG